MAQFTPPRKPRTLLYSPRRFAQSLTARRVLVKLLIFGTSFKIISATLTPFKDLTPPSSNPCRYLGSSRSTTPPPLPSSPPASFPTSLPPSPLPSASNGRETKSKSTAIPSRTSLTTGVYASGTGQTSRTPLCDISFWPTKPRKKSVREARPVVFVFCVVGILKTSEKIKSSLSLLPSLPPILSFLKAKTGHPNPSLPSSLPLPPSFLTVGGDKQQV